MASIGIPSPELPVSFTNTSPNVVDNITAVSGIIIRTLAQSIAGSNLGTCTNASSSQPTRPTVAFLVGCSRSFETALAKAGLPPQHNLLERAVPVYRTPIAMNPAGGFTGGIYAVSMRPYEAADTPRVHEITQAYNATYSEPIAWEWGARKKVGIADIHAVD